MKLAMKEIIFYKFRYLLIMLIIFLLSVMVMFISGLAQGLARENISLFEQLKSQHYIIEKMDKPQLEKSNITEQQQEKIQRTVGTEPLKMQPQTINSTSEKQEVTMLSIDDSQKPSLKSGKYPSTDREIAINDKLTGEGLNIGDNITFEGHDKTYKISGVLNDTMYSHSSMILMNKDGFKEMNTNATSAFPVQNLSNKQRDQIQQLKGVEFVTENELMDNIASYQAEQAPLNMIIVSLFFITAIVLSAFFYVMTIQKLSQIGILKAIGIKTKHLLQSLVLQIFVITLMSVLISMILILLVSILLPVTMPFYLSLSNLILVIGIFMIVALVGALLSFIKVLRVDPIEAIGGSE